MIYTENTKKAIKLMFEKHKNQVDKSGIPYVFHPWHVAEQMKDENSVLVALMHDLLEDTDVTLDDIEELGFDSDVVNALSLMTHDKNMDYFDYVRRLANNDLARRVKLADLEHNMDFSRLDPETRLQPKRIEKYQKYKKCYDYLKAIEDNTSLHPSQASAIEL